jgi:predicted GNAT family N-acyltransferase
VDEHDATDAVHALASWKGVPCGAGRFVLRGGVAKIGRLAVVDDARGRGAGTALLRFLEEEARKRGARELMLWAQVTARPFYERFGYVARGPGFDDAGIQHVEMHKPAG